MESRAHLIRYPATSMPFWQNVPLLRTECAEVKQSKHVCKEVPESVSDVVVFQLLFVSSSSPKSTMAQEKGQILKKNGYFPQHYGSGWGTLLYLTLPLQGLMFSEEQNGHFGVCIVLPSAKDTEAAFPSLSPENCQNWVTSQGPVARGVMRAEGRSISQLPEKRALGRGFIRGE